jgi:hypothetical protein
MFRRAVLPRFKGEEAWMTRKRIRAVTFQRKKRQEQLINPDARLSHRHAPTRIFMGF